MFLAPTRKTFAAPALRVFSLARCSSSSSVSANTTIVQPRKEQVMISNLSPNPGSHINEKRLGRGGKRGGSSGRGNGGQKHHGKAPPPWFSSLYTNPIIQALPRWTWAPRELKPRYRTLNLDRIQFWVDTGRLKVNPGKTLTMADLVRAKVIPGRVQSGIKLLGNGSTYFKLEGLQLEVSRASKSAIAAVEQLGGKVTCVYHTKSGLKQLLTSSSAPLEYFYEPPVLESDIEYYSNAANRGYLADKTLFDQEFRPRGYIYSIEEFNSLNSPDNVTRVKVKYNVADMPELLKSVEQKRAWRQMWYENEQERLRQEQLEKNKRWSEQKWFEQQTNTSFKWVEVNEEGKVKFNNEA